MKIPYVSLHNHTTGSIGDSLITPKELFETTIELGQSAVAVTDHGSCSALWESYQISKKSDVKLIAGAECFFVNDNKNNDDTTLRHIILLAKNATGYKNLLTINKRGFDNYTISFKKAIARVDWKLLEEFSDGLICTSACGNGVIGQFIMADQYDEAKAAAKRFKDIFGDNFALELQAHNLQIRQCAWSGPVNQQKINLALKKIANELDIRCIVTTDAHYVKQEHARAHDVYLCNSSGQPITSGNRLKYDKHEFYMRSADSLYAHFERHMKMWGEEFVHSLFENTEYYSEQCEKPDFIDPAVVTGEKCQLPVFNMKEEKDYPDFINWVSKNKENPGKNYKENLNEDALFYRYRSEIGLEKRIAKGQVPETDRDLCYKLMNDEYEVFEYRNFSSYMLIVADILDICRSSDITLGPGRGSGGGSITAYFNNIHQAYPVRYGLIFARFLNKFKEAYPDLDLDIAPSGRSILHTALKEKYGYDSVVHVSNINTITPKVYARDISRIFEFGGEGRSKAAEIGDAIADSIPADIHSVRSALKDAPLFAEYAKQYPELEEFADLLNGKPRAWSTHAGGIVISKRSLEGLVPLRKDASGASVLEYDKIEAEDNGLIKIDTLGLETLDIINDTYKLIRESGIEIDDDFNYESNDPETYDLISKGDTFGVFQLASTAVHVCKKVQPKNIDDIALITALVRPAAKDTIPALLKVRDGDDEMSLIHPSLERAFAGTYGFGLFEESLMYLALDMAAWDLHEADKLRKLTKLKGKSPELVEQWHNEFIEGAIKNNIPKEIADRTWTETVNGFNGYGFNKCLSGTVIISTYSKDGEFIENKQIKDIVPGEFVRSRDEGTGEDIFVEVLYNHNNGEKNLVEVELDSGERVKCTMNHKFRTKETGKMLSLSDIIKRNLTIVVRSADRKNLM